MSKERLEEIKNSYLEGLHRFFGTPWVSMPKENSDWLIEQAERVQELEETVEDYKAVNKELHQRGRKLRKQNKRYRKVINNINEKAMLYGVDEQVFEAIKEAIKPLEGEG